VVVALAVVVETEAATTVMEAVLPVQQMDKMRQELLRLFPERLRVVVAEIVAVAGTAVETVEDEAARQALRHRPPERMQPPMMAGTMPQDQSLELQAIVAAV
jgi:hypothetical protein